MECCRAGTPTVLDLSGTPYVFTHKAQLAEFTYNINTGDIITPGEINAGTFSHSVPAVQIKRIGTCAT